MQIVADKPLIAKSRLNVRLTPEIKLRIDQAAAILGQDLTEFATSTLSQRANDVIEKNEEFVLTQAERKFFMDYLAGDYDPKPSQKTIEATERYKRGRQKGVTYELSD